MAIVITRLINDQRGSSDSPELGFLVSGDTDGGAIIAAVIAAIGGATVPSTVNGKPASGISSCQQIQGSYGSQWEVWLRYSIISATAFDIGDKVLLSFSTQGGTQHLTTSYSTMAWTPGNTNGSSPTDTSVPDYKNAIGVSGVGDTDIAGVEVDVSAFNFTIRKKFAAADFDWVQVQYWYFLTAHKNDAEFTITVDLGNSGLTMTMTFAAGDLKFRGVNAPEPGTDGSVTVPFEFSASPSLGLTSSPDSSLTIGDLAPLTFKRGWDYVWTHFKLKEISSSVFAVVPDAAYVEEVVLDGNLDLLGLPP
jgi:hypothetical protein